jgi:ribosome-binding factor A
MTVKQERIQDRVREIISGLLFSEVTDPALKGVTVTDVVMDRELEHAEVYVNALGDESRQGEVMAGLKRAGGFLRRELGKRLHLRRVPILQFRWDITLARADAMEAKLNQLRTDLRNADLRSADQPLPEPGKTEASTDDADKRA